MIHNQISQKIKLLPEHLIDQIKAGEVIERPSSLIKELIENSLDANATKIDIHIVENGLNLIHIRDNGEGMYLSDLPFAFSRHATSKIERFDDLYRLTSFGFRGEALASMAAVSKITCTTAPRNQLSLGGKIIIEGGQILSHLSSEGQDAGTDIYIKDLFYNTPARMKFIKSSASEKNSLKRILYSFVLANKHVSFSIKWDDKEKEFFPAVTEKNFEERVKKVFFKNTDIHTDLILISGEYEGYFVKGYISKFANKSSVNKRQYLFANKRLFSDKSIHAAIARSLASLWEQGETGHYAFFLELPLDHLDVNVHPSKIQLKFFKASTVYSLVTSAIKKAFVTETHGPQVTHASETSPLSLFQKNKLVDLIQPEHFPSYSKYNKQASTGDLVKITDNFSLVNHEGVFYLIHDNQFISSYVEKMFDQNPDISENNVIPLLISRPYRVILSKVSSSLDLLKRMGLELDPLNDTTLVLRSIPDYLEAFNYEDIVRNILSSVENNKKVSTRGDYQLTGRQQFDLILNALGITTILEAKTLTPLDDSKLKKLF